MKLSENFYLIEFTRSQTATRKGIDNIPTTEHIYNLRQLCYFILQPLRQALGFPLQISSGYRSVQLNRAIGGSTTSQHSIGQAADLVHPEKNKDIFDYIRKNLPFDQLIWEFGNNDSPDWVHVSWAIEKRGEVMAAQKGDYGTEYTYMP